MFCIGTLFRCPVSPEDASEMWCFFSNICDNWNIFVTVAPHWRYPYFDIVVGLTWLYDPENYAGSSDATGMASSAI
jgi:hypothetical protein